MNWCDENYLYLNVSKTKEMCIDCSKNQRCPKSVYVKEEAAERVETYKYLSVVFNSKLKGKENINSVLKKVYTRMYCLRKLRSFGVNSGVLVTLYNAVICSIIVYGSVCWGGNISKCDRGRLEQSVKKAGRVVGMPLDSFKTLYEKRLFKKLRQVLNDPTHPMRHYLDSTPQWGAAVAEIKVSSGENTELKRSPFQAWSRSVYSHTCYAYCQGVLPCLFLPFVHSSAFFPNLSQFFPVLACRIK